MSRWFYYNQIQKSSTGLLWTKLISRFFHPSHYEKTEVQEKLEQIGTEGKEFGKIGKKGRKNRKSVETSDSESDFRVIEIIEEAELGVLNIPYSGNNDYRRYEADERLFKNHGVMRKCE